VRSIDEFSLLTALKPPVRRLCPLCRIFSYVRLQLDRQVFDAALQWAMKADKTHFWRGGSKKPAKIESPHDIVAAIKKTATTRMKTDEYV
jgi:phosphoinositide-3-kinase regulatory subunit 4